MGETILLRAIRYYLKLIISNLKLNSHINLYFIFNFYLILILSLFYLYLYFVKVSYNLNVRKRRGFRETTSGMTG